MSRFKKTKNFVSLIMVLAVCLVIGLSATDSFGQKGSKGRYRKVSLKKDARKNSYKITVEATANYFEANDVEDPLTKKLLEGLKKLEYRCRRDDDLTTISLSYTSGRSQRIRVSCPLLIQPQIIIEDENQTKVSEHL